MTPETETRPIPSEVTALAQTAPHFLEQVCVIESGEDMQLAMAQLKQIKASLATFKPARDEFLRPARESLKYYEKRFDEAAEPIIRKLGLAKTSWETNILTYSRAEQARAAEENRRREEEVRKQQDAMRAQAAAEAARAAAQAAEKRRKAEEAAAAGRAAQAAKLASQADSIESAAETKVAVLETTAASITAPSVAADVPKSEAGHFSTRTSGHVRSFAELRDIERKAVGEHAAECLTALTEQNLAQEKQAVGLVPLVCAIADGIRNGTFFPPINLLKINQTNVNNLSRSNRMGFDNIPGLALDTKTNITSSRK